MGLARPDFTARSSSTSPTQESQRSGDGGLREVDRGSSLVGYLPSPEYGGQKLAKSCPQDTREGGGDTQVHVAFDDTAVKAIVRSALQAYPAKHVARLTNENHRTVEAWRAGRSLPSLPAFFNLVRHVPCLRVEVQRALKLSETDEEFQRALNDLIRAAQRVRL